MSVKSIALSLILLTSAVASQAQVSGQSCGQAAWTLVME